MKTKRIRRRKKTWGKWGTSNILLPGYLYWYRRRHQIVSEEVSSAAMSRVIGEAIDKLYKKGTFDFSIGYMDEGAKALFSHGVDVEGE